MLTKIKQFWTDLRPYEKAGTAALLLGILIAICFIGWLFYDGNIVLGGKIDLEKAGQAGSFIAGTSGVCWALAGAFFFVSALRLQQQETTERSFEAKFYNILNQINITRPRQFRREGFLIDRWVEQKIIGDPDYERNLSQEELNEYQFKHQDRSGEDPFHMRVSVEGRITYELDSIVSKMRENIREVEIHPEEITLYNIFFTSLEIIENHSEKINLNIKILLDHFRWYELRFIFYWSYINPENQKNLETIKKLRIKIPTDYYYNWKKHSQLFE